MRRWVQWGEVITESDQTSDRVLPLPAEAASTSTILQATRELLRTVPVDVEDADARYTAVASYLAALSHRGIDAEAMLRVALLPDIVASLLAPIVIGIVAPEANAESGDTERLSEWRQLLDLEPLEPPASDRSSEPSSQMLEDFRLRFEEVVRRTERALSSWTSSASIDEIIRCIPPKQLVPEPESQRLEPRVRDQYLWFRDRFSGRPIKSWIPRSVELEYSWQKNQIAAPFNVDVMEEVSFDPAELATTIADRVVGAIEGWSNWPSLRDQVYYHAKRLLRSGRSIEAAALFEFFAGQDGAEIDSLNDRGFCLIPDDPGAALHFLELAEKRGYQPAAVNRYNQICCHLALGNHTSALAVADFYWREWFEDHSVSATLWRRSGQAWVIEDIDDARVRLAQLALQIAQLAEDVGRATTWARRVAGIIDGSRVL